MRVVKQYRQLPLNGTYGDYARSVDTLAGFTEFTRAVEEFIKANSDANPRHLEYIMNAEVTEATTMALLEGRDDE